MSFDLLDTVLPSDGRYCVVGIGNYVDQRFAETREQAEEIIQEFIGSNVNVYFGCSKFGQLNDRTHDNVVAIRALWLDIDCGPTKGVPNEKGKIEGYLDQEIGLGELQKFCATVGLPKPILVNSGHGIHAYWLLEQTLTRKEWDPLAKRFKQLCKQHGLIVDDKVFEASRVLRVPGSINIKKGKDQMPVVVWNEETVRMTYEQVRTLFGENETAPEEEPDFLPRAMSPMSTSPSTTAPFSSTATQRSASPSRATPRSAPMRSTSRASAAGAVAPTESLIEPLPIAKGTTAAPVRVRASSA